MKLQNSLLDFACLLFSRHVNRVCREKLLFGFYVLLPGLLPADFEGTIVYGVTQTSIFDGYPRDSLGNAFFDIHDVRVHPRYQGDWCCNC